MCRLNDGIGIERNRIDSLADEKLRELRIIGRRLTADADLLACPDRSVDRHRYHLLDGAVAFVKQVRDHLRIAIEPQRKLRQVIRSDRISIEYLQELVSENYIRRQLAHRVDLKTILALHKTVFAHERDNFLPFFDSSTERYHRRDVGQSHVLACS